VREADPYLEQANRKRLVSDAFLVGEERESEKEARRRRSDFKVVK
jgi:hypothetical protein